MTNLNDLRALFPHADREDIAALARMIEVEWRIDSMDFAMRAMTWAEGMMMGRNSDERKAILICRP